MLQHQHGITEMTLQIEEDECVVRHHTHNSDHAHEHHHGERESHPHDQSHQH